MKNIAKYFILAATASTMFATSCIEETEPTTLATEEQLGSSAKATEALLAAMPSFFNVYDNLGTSRHNDFGYSSVMHVRDVMTADMTIVESDYDWFQRWETNTYQGDSYYFTRLVYNYYFKFIQTTNNIAGAVDEETATDLQKFYLGNALAFRALCYLDVARMYEFLPSDVIPGDASILNLTVPVVTEKTAQSDAQNNPRVSHKEMYEFILNDLCKAEQYIGLSSRIDKTYPDLTAVYGLKSRLFLWDQQYDSAAIYARKAIDLNKYRPTTKEEWLDVTTGFNTLSEASWIWGSQLVAEDDAVQTGICNWTSWMSPEAYYGYASAGPMPMIDAQLYNSISDDDWRKLSFIAPANSPLAGQTPLVQSYEYGLYMDGLYYILNANNQYYAAFPEYTGVKFRPNQGNLNEYAVGSASAFPVMRIEEMYFTEAEAYCLLGDPAKAKELLNAFMQTYRYSTYTGINGTSQDAVFNEIFKQKRMEFWGEGITFYDYKSLNLSVDRQYDGNNYQGLATFKTNGRPAWMSLVIPNSETNYNTAIVNNPDPSDLYTPLTE